MPPQFETVNIIPAGSARFDGAAAVISLDGSLQAPAWTDAASAAAWKALFNKPTAASMSLAYVAHADVYVEGGDSFMTRVAGALPTVANGYKWVNGREEAMRNEAQPIRDIRFFLPAGVSLYVSIYTGTL